MPPSPNPASPSLAAPAHWVRVFNLPGSEAGGNPAPVWLQADAMDTAAMQAAAHASGHESVFVLRPDDSSRHDWRMRYFVPRHEMEMCGHATVGALWLLHRLGAWDGAPTRIQTLSGTVQARHEAGRVEISQPRGRVEPVQDAALLARTAQCLGLAPGRIAAVANASTSRVKTLVRLDSAATLHGLAVDFAAVEALCTDLGSTGLYPYAPTTAAGAGAVTVSARQFPKSSGYPEDAATGIAAAALAWGLRADGLVGADGVLVTVHQGEAMGSPSAIAVRLPAEADGAESGRCWLSGHAADMAPMGH